jgi:hypothetical protein
MTLLLRCTLSVALLFLCTPFSASARIEPWTVGYESPFRSAIEADVIELIKESIDLGEEQMNAIDRLYKAHQRRFEAFVEKNRPDRDRLDEAVRATRRGENWLEKELERERELARIADEQAALDARFLDEVKEILAEVQEAQWSEVQRRIRRHRWLGSTPVYLEGDIDIIRLVESVREDLDIGEPPPALGEALDAYSRRIDEALLTLASFERSLARTYFRRNEDRFMMNERGDWYMGPAEDPGELNRQMRRRMRLAAKIRDLNREYSSLVERLLPRVCSRALRDRYQRLALHDLLDTKRLLADSFIEKQVLELEDLTDEQREAIEAIRLESAERADRQFAAVVRAADLLRETKLKPHTPNEAKELGADVRSKAQEFVELEQNLINAVWGLLDETHQAALDKPSIELWMWGSGP